jgi:hypothetical protein
LVYGQEAIVPTHTFLPSLKLAQSVKDKACSVMQERLNMLLKLEEEREKSNMNLTQHQEMVKICYCKAWEVQVNPLGLWVLVGSGAMLIWYRGIFFDVMDARW